MNITMNSVHFANIWCNFHLFYFILLLLKHIILVNEYNIIISKTAF